MLQSQKNEVFSVIKVTLRAEDTFSRYELASTFRTPAHTAKM